MTLVITSDSPLVRSLWTLSSLDSVEAAKTDLALREDIKDKDICHSIGVWLRDAKSKENIDTEIDHWASRLNLDAVIWTTLKPRFRGQKRTPTSDEVVAHIKGLSHEQRANAERYVRNAPRQIDTPYRRRMQQEFGWTPLGPV